MKSHILTTLSTNLKNKMASKWVYPLIFCLLLGGVSIPTLAYAQGVTTVTQAVQFSNIRMLTRQSGWAWNENSPYHVYRTLNGPQRWQDVTPPVLITNSQVELTSTYFPDITHAYLGVMQGSSVLLLHTSDGGKSWQSTSFSVASGFFLSQVVFVDAQHGWLNFGTQTHLDGASALLLMHTNNGGKSWQTISYAGLTPAYFTSTRFAFTDQQNGWATGLNPNNVAYLYHSIDGGSTWSAVNVAAIAGGVSPVQSYGPYWQNCHTGTLYVQYTTKGGQGYKVLTAYRTHDGGQHWIAEAASPALNSFQDLFTFSFLNARHAWSFGFDGQGQFVLHHTNNGSHTWQILHPTGLLKADEKNQVIGDVSFLNASTGWVTIKDSNNNWYLFQSDNAGQSWQALQPVLG